MPTVIDAVSQHADIVLQRARDRWGEQTPLLADGFALASGEPLRWQEGILSNLARQQNLLRTLNGLTAVTGETRWQSAADNWIGHGLRVLQNPDSDLLYWGGHSAWDLGADGPLQGNHELKCAFPHYEGLFRVDAAATARFIDAFWHAHIWDWSSLLFNRHGEYADWDRSQTWREGEFADTWQLPIIENSALSFINTGSDLIWAACERHRLTNDALPLAWATALLSRYDAIRHADTGLGGYQFNHREPCRVRASFKAGLGSRADVNETTVIGKGYIGIRYGRVAVMLLNIAESLGAAGDAPFREFVRRDLTALWEHAWEDETGCFHAMLNDGTRLSPDDVEDVGYCPPAKLGATPANGLMLLSYARAGRVLGDDTFYRAALRLAEVMGWGRLADGEFDADTARTSLTGGPDDAFALEGLLDLYRTHEATHLLSAATTLGQAMIERHSVDGVFAALGDGGDAFPLAGASDEDSTRCTGIDSALPVALLHLTSLLSPGAASPPLFVPCLSYFDPKILARQRGLRP
jgi:pectate lyase